MTQLIVFTMYKTIFPSFYFQLYNHIVRANLEKGKQIPSAAQFVLVGKIILSERLRQCPRLTFYHILETHQTILFCPHYMLHYTPCTARYSAKRSLLPDCMQKSSKSIEYHCGVKLKGRQNKHTERVHIRVHVIQ